MKVIVAGSRGISSTLIVSDAIKESGFVVSEVVSGTAIGVDREGEYWAKVNKIPVKRFPANWNKYGKSAGYKRNVEMSKYADAAIIVWDGKSNGSRHMIKIARNEGLKVFIKTIS